MRHLFIMVLVGLLGFGLAVDHAEARRLGGGKSFGSYSRSTDGPAATPSRNTATNNATNSASQPSRGLSRFAGPFAGLLAGGLLASLFFGGAFDNIRFLDILLVAGAIWLAFRLFRSFRRQQPATATGLGSQPQSRTTSTRDAQPQSGSSVPTRALGGTPGWFDKERFLTGAKEHFMTLQRAWDNNDLSGIQEYVSPELYNLLRQERANQPANNRTEIVRLFAELGSVQEYDKQAEATVIFHGIIDENGEQNEFNETWHLTRELREGAPWYVQGIEQNPSV
ncbi:Tim44 domain-containing protein [Halomonas shantousis]